MKIRKAKQEHGPIFSEDTLAAKIMNVNVLKLDGTAFEISVLDGASVADLKASLEFTANDLQKKSLGQGSGSIDWDQVWANFCLCYMNQKLLDDSATLRSIGIQRDDQITFVCHKSCQNTRRKRWLGGCFAHP
ncbi:U11/U12 small nuclear ribonucleoprotein 25 kDa protein-like [Selaginella moellendorffii]|uniref:U11/U12 small nuclear ribonucleoprotein 25 kDa protein-like n=1 Tax=Selaginella moellendorffii TaxID=88036 RepID=UPI000D1C8160|nr:U11/U12 small nuclear ribonucleoprotein 25 kDa protein-like [Selaginella moellendorffii]|eukprot:XP_024516961.1 U11/U12 small nuclear ribonucleoprotein 25 kDa protein-like [Selaginella moellendorffii]